MIDALALPAVRESTLGAYRLDVARPDDAPQLLRFFAADPVARSRGTKMSVAEPEALLARIQQTQNNVVLVVRPGHEHAPCATAQLTLIPGLSRGEATRLLVEGVQVDPSRRSGGIGSAIMRWIMDDAAPALGATMVQLSSDATRRRAHRFYERLGFAPSHVSFKYHVPPTV